MLKNPCDFLINRISVIVQRRRYKGRRKGWKSSEIRIEGRGIDSWKRSLHFVRSVHIESKSRRTIKADVSIWTCRDFLFFPLFSAFILPLPLFLWFHSPLPYSLLPSLFFLLFLDQFFLLKIYSSGVSFLDSAVLCTHPHHLSLRILFLARLLYLTEREPKITVLFIYHVSPVIKELLCALYPCIRVCKHFIILPSTFSPSSCSFDLMEWRVLVELCSRVSCSILIEMVMEGRLIVLRLIFPCLKSFKDCDIYIYVRTYFSRFIYIYFSFFFFFCLALCSDWKINLKFYYLTFCFEGHLWCVTFTTCNKITVKIYRNRNLCRSFKIEGKKKKKINLSRHDKSSKFNVRLHR